MSVFRSFRVEGALLLIPLILLLLSSSDNGPYTLKPAFRHPLPRLAVTEAGGRGEMSGMVAPVAADLNGDGRVEVILASSAKRSHGGHGAMLKLLDVTPDVVAPFQSNGAAFRNAHVLAETSLLPARVRVNTGRTPVAIATGYLQHNNKQGGTTTTMGGGRKQVIGVLTDGWIVMLFDHNLKLLWEASIQGSFPNGAKAREVALVISEHAIEEGDEGSVFVGGSIVPRRGEGASEDAGMSPAQREQLREARASSVDPEEDVEEAGLVDTSHHFSYYAFEGRTGVRRWEHNSNDYYRDMENGADNLEPQMAFVLDKETANRRQFGEVTCKEYRESVLAAMPHRWTARGDTEFKLAHFTKHLHSQQRGGGRSKGGGMFGSSPSAAVGHFMGTSPAVGQSAKKAEDNVLVAYLKEGIEIVHLYTGRPICKIFLGENEAHADMNGDGVVDHVAAITRRKEPGADPKLHDCWSEVTSGLGERESLYTGSICRFNSNMRRHGSEIVDVLTPLLIPRSGSSSGSSARPQQQTKNAVTFIGKRDQEDLLQHSDNLKKFNAIFLNSRGEVTMYSPNGRRKWLVSAKVSWVPESESSSSVYPSLNSIPVRTGHAPSLIVAAGEKMVAVLDRKGSIVWRQVLESAPQAPVSAIDFNGDGYTDLVVITKDAMYGYQAVVSPAAVPFRVLLGMLILGIGLVFIAQSDLFQYQASSELSFGRKL